MNDKPNIKKFNLPLPMDLMEDAQQQADVMGISLNAYCLLAIRNFTAYTRRSSPQPARSRKPVSSTTHPAPAAWLGERVGRNEPCPCGSGRKAKH